MIRLFGMDLPDLPEGVTALECVMSIKALSEDDNVNLYERKTQGLNMWEAAGMAITLADSLRATLTRSDDDL